jgi:SAM-dependent methyltransferase
MAQVNTFSPTWHTLFSANRDEQHTEREVSFLAGVLPPPPAAVLDVPCGFGRHARGLAALGYSMTGVELDERIVAEATRRSSGAIEYVEGDMRDLSALPRDFDGVICMWASFGYFDHATNQAVLRGMAERLWAGGRLVLDVYNPEFMTTHEGTVTNEVGRHLVTEMKSLEGGRLRVELSYDGGPVEDVFEWELYRPEDLDSLAMDCGLARVLAACEFDESRPPAPEVPRMQLVFERTARA